MKRFLLTLAVAGIALGASAQNKGRFKIAYLNSMKKYNSCLALADVHGLQSIAFCCISTGGFGFPQRRAAEIAVGTVRAYLDTTVPTSINAVIFNVFKDEDLL